MKEKHINILLQKENKHNIRIIWLHGWGQDSSAFAQLVPKFSNYENISIDLPGFGSNKPPQEVWGTKNYADYVVKYLSKLPAKKTYIIGHSFGCRVALRIAEKEPNLLAGLILIAAAGLKRKRSLIFRLKASCLKLFVKIMKIIDYFFNSKFKEKFANNFGSADYREAQGIMRKIFVKTIIEDLSEIACKIKLTTLLIYGGKDQQTPPELGKKYNILIENSQYFELAQFDHYNILTNGRHQLHNIITKYIERSK